MSDTLNLMRAEAFLEKMANRFFVPMKVLDARMNDRGTAIACQIEVGPLTRMINPDPPAAAEFDDIKPSFQMESREYPALTIDIEFRDDLDIKAEDNPLVDLVASQVAEKWKTHCRQIDERAR